MKCIKCEKEKDQAEMVINAYTKKPTNICRRCHNDIVYMNNWKRKDPFEINSEIDRLVHLTSLLCEVRKGK